MKGFFISLKEEFKAKWKELTAIILINIFELYALSAVLTHMPIWGVILVSLTLLLPAIALIVLVLRERKADKQDIKILFLFIGVAILFGVIKSYLYVVSLIIAYLFYKDKKSMYKWLFLISLVLLSIFVIFTLLKILPEVAFVRHDETYINIINVRHTFGFNHPNHILKYVLATSVFGYMWFGDHKKYTLIFTIVMAIVTLWLSWLTSCRTGLLVLGAMYLLMNVPFTVNWFKPKRIFFLFVLISFVMISFRGISEINRILSGRPAWFNFFFQNFPQYILFGKYYVVKLLADFSIDSYVQYPLDNDFFMTIFDGGLFALLAICYFFYMAFEKNTDKKVVVAIMGIFAYGLTEAFELAFTYPLYIMMFVELIDIYYKNKDNIKIFKRKKKEIEAPSE